MRSRASWVWARRAFSWTVARCVDETSRLCASLWSTCGLCVLIATLGTLPYVQAVACISMRASGTSHLLWHAPSPSLCHAILAFVSELPSDCFKIGTLRDSRESSLNVGAEMAIETASRCPGDNLDQLNKLRQPGVPTHKTQTHLTELGFAAFRHQFQHDPMSIIARRAGDKSPPFRVFECTYKEA